MQRLKKWVSIMSIELYNTSGTQAYAIIHILLVCPLCGVDTKKMTNHLGYITFQLKVKKEINGKKGWYGMVLLIGV